MSYRMSKAIRDELRQLEALAERDLTPRPTFQALDYSPAKTYGCDETGEMILARHATRITR